MCGIAGIRSTAVIDPVVIRDMIQALVHRGPDAQGTCQSDNGYCALGHTRLSIIDLNPEANQPFYSASGRSVVVFNGEIYNFQSLRSELASKHGVVFRTTSDTEVLAEGYEIWGKELVTRLEGMFAVAIDDRLRNKLVLFRDRIGKKPLYYFKSSSLLAFASEIKSLMRHPEVQRQKKTNRKVISTFLHLGYIPEPYTIYENIFKFPAGHVAEVDESLDLKTSPYWSVERILVSRQTLTETGAQQQLQTLLADAVRKRLISDVPLGSFLSGGTDSSLVSAIASRQVSGKLKTFSIGFEESKYDESAYARAVARHLGTDHVEFRLSEKDAQELLETYLHHFDEPFADTSAIPTMMVSKLARKEVTVALTGDGGDELFQGYGAYRWAERLASPPWKIARPFLHAGFGIGTSRLKRIARMMERVPVRGLRSHIFSQEQYFFSQQEIEDKLLADPGLFNLFEYDETVLAGSDYTSGERQALFDLRYYLKDDLLVKVDRASMYYALECRSPLLDSHVVEFAFALPDSLKRRRGISKWILKEILSGYLPQDLVHRPKWGFSIPLAKWLTGDLNYLVKQYLDPLTIQEVGLFDSTYVAALIRDFYAGQEYLYNRLWLLIVMHKWWKENA